mgnify:CR=1 FL=1
MHYQQNLGPGPGPTPDDFTQYMLPTRVSEVYTPNKGPIDLSGQLGPLHGPLSPHPPTPEDFLPKNQETANKAIERLEQSASNGQSLSVHDHHAVPILQEILSTLQGKAQTGAAGAGGSTANFTQVDTAGLDASINNFSSAVSDLERIMSGPIKMEVGGELNVNVNLTGAEVLQESEAAFAQMAGRKVTEGINNFIRDGLRNSSIAIKGDWTA